MAQISTRKRGNTWEYSFEIGKVNGKRKRYSKGGFRTKKECLEAGTQAKAEYDNTGTTFKTSEITLHDLLDEWFKDYVKVYCKPLTQYNYDQMIRLHIKPSIGDLKIKTISAKIIQDFLKSKSDEGLSNGYVRNMRGVLQNAFNYAITPCEYIKSNPVTFIKIKYKSEEPKKELKCLTSDQFQQILDSHTRTTSYFKIFLYIGWYTGMRKGEISALTWDDVDFENKRISINKTSYKLNGKWYTNSPKTKSSYRTILVGDTLIDILKDWKQKQIRIAKELEVEPPELVATNYKLQQISYSIVESRCRLIYKKTGIDFHFHLLRHTHATLLLQNGASIKDVQARLGHSSMNTTLDTYAHDTNVSNQHSVDVFEKILDVDKR